jgi:hypothetical protein
MKHPKTYMTWPGFEPLISCTVGGHSAKELFEQLINSYSEFLYRLIIAAYSGTSTVPS